MSITRYQTCGNLVNRVAVEVGLSAVADVFSNNDPAFGRLTGLLTTTLQELAELHPWERLIREFQYTTGTSENGPLDLPSDFYYMIPQTGWERSSDVPLIGPLGPEGWTYLLGRDLVGSTIYASFRFSENKLNIYPSTPMPDGLDINFEYVSRNLIQDAEESTTYHDEPDTHADIIMLPPHVVSRLLKKKFLEASGFDSQAATQEYNLALDSAMGKNNSGGVLTLSRNRWGGFYLDGYRNTPDTGFGS